MKKVFGIQAIMFVVTMPVFAQKKTTSKTIIPQNKVSSESFADKEAKAEAHKYFDSVVSKCDGSTYLLRKYRETLIELKGESIKVEPSKLTAADKLNEVEWIGVVKLTPQFIRPYYYPNRQWQDWAKSITVGSDYIIIDGEVEIRLKKKKGMPWETTYTEPIHEKVACEELPWRNVESLAKRDAEAKQTAEAWFSKFFSKCVSTITLSTRFIKQTLFASKNIQFRFSRNFLQKTNSLRVLNGMEML